MRSKKRRKPGYLLVKILLIAALLAQTVTPAFASPDHAVSQVEKSAIQELVSTDVPGGEQTDSDAADMDGEETNSTKAEEETAAILPVVIDEVCFPDDIFRSIIATQYDADQDEILSVEEIQNTITLDVAKQGIKSLKGVEIFVNLQSLNCADNQLSGLNLDGLTNLQELYCEGNCIRIELDEDNQFDLTMLQDFVPEKAWDFSAGTVSEENMLMLDESYQDDSITYYYSHGGTGKEDLEPFVTFTLLLPVKETQEPVDNAGNAEITKAAVIPAPAKATQPKAQITSLKYIKSGTAEVKIKKIKAVSGYEIKFATNSKFTKSVRIKTTSATTATVTSLLKGKYYVKARAFVKDSKGNKKYYPYGSAKILQMKKGLVLVEPTATSARIDSCKIITGGKVQVESKLDNVLKSADDKYYLFALNSYQNSIPASRKPLKSVYKTKHLTFTAALNAGKSNSVLQSKFVVAVKVSGGKYKVVSKARYITNPAAIAKYKQAYPSVKSKKGLQINTQMPADTKSLGVKHATINMPLELIIAKQGEIRSGAVVSYNYNGKTYYFSSIIYDFDDQVRNLCSKGIIVSSILLMRYNQELVNLIAPKGRTAGHETYALNVETQAARQQWEATFSFLAERYSKSKSMRICNWVLSNEIDNHDSGNYAGNVSFSKYVAIYTDSFRMLSTAVHSIYSKARVFISLDHLWNIQTAANYKAKSVLDQFAKKLKEEGNIPWHIAYHAYPSPLTSPCFWANMNGQINSKLTSAVINMGNLNVLTDYVKKQYGSSHRIILSEQGFTSVANKKTDEKMQSAAIVYAYYIAEFNDMIDSFILHRHVDHREEMSQGLYLGLWVNNTSQYEYPSRKKDAWAIFKYMDTPVSTSKTNFAKAKIGILSWKAVVPGFDANKFNKM